MPEREQPVRRSPWPTFAATLGAYLAAQLTAFVFGVPAAIAVGSLCIAILAGVLLARRRRRNPPRADQGL